MKGDAPHPLAGAAGYAPHPIVHLEAGEINGRVRVLGPTVIDYVALLMRSSAVEAGVMIRDKLYDGRLKAEGPDGPIDDDFWCYAAISPDGDVFCIKTQTRLAWFKLRAADVLKIWEPPTEWLKPQPQDEVVQNVVVEPTPPEPPPPPVRSLAKIT